jgi:hypothetical protein
MTINDRLVSGMNLSFVVLFVGSLFLQGCTGYKLVGSRSDNFWVPDELQWKHGNQSRLPQNELERLAVKVASSHRPVVDGKIQILYVSDDKSGILVAAVEDISSDHDVYSMKKVTRFLILSDRVYAWMEPSLEPFPDVLFERSVILAAKGALADGVKSIMVLLDWSEPVTLKATVSNRCLIEVTAYRTDSMGRPGNEVCEKIVNMCRPE